ncbi:MAG: glycosyltransferase family 1 protein [Myxococcota bacterium]|nr:glycosyltransferase family 1 protein [Myxococcota bacterium]
MSKATNDLICLSHLRWGFVYQRPNHLMSRFARDRRVFFVEEPVVDVDEGPARMEVREAAARLWVAVPHLPEGLSPEETEDAQRALLDAMIRERGVRDPVLWFYTPMALGFARHLNAAAVVYDCMDQLAAFRGAPPELEQRERDLLARADVVFTGGQSLYESKRTQHPRVHAFPSSVDATHFARARHETQQPEDQARIPHPRLGYFGVIDERIDFDLLERIADAKPEWQLVMVGPIVKVDPESLPQRPNLHWLGQKGYAELPSYVGGWDVALMPFALNESTRYISPTKTLEYLAAGKPVVSTAIRDVARPYGERGLVRIANPSSFVDTITATLAEDAVAANSRRTLADAYVAGTSWDDTHARMAEIVSRAITAGLHRSGTTATEGRSAAGRVIESAHEDHGEGTTTCSTI